MPTYQAPGSDVLICEEPGYKGEGDVKVYLKSASGREAIAPTMEEVAFVFKLFYENEDRLYGEFEGRGKLERYLAEYAAGGDAKELNRRYKLNRLAPIERVR